MSVSLETDELAGPASYPTGGFVLSTGLSTLNALDLVVKTPSTLPSVRAVISRNTPGAGQATIKLMRRRYDKLSSIGDVTFAGSLLNSFPLKFMNLYTSGNFGTHTKEYEATVKKAVGSAISSASLYDQTAGAKVTGGTHETTSASYELKRSSALTLTSGDEMDSVGGDVAISSSRLAVNVSSPTAIEQQINIIDREFSTTSGSLNPQPTDNSLGIIKWDSTKFNGTVQVFFEAVIKNDGGDNTSVSLFTEAGSSVGASSISSASGTYTRVRSAAFTLSSNNYSVRITTSGTGRAYIQSARLIIVQTASPTLTETQIELGYSLDSGTASEQKKLWTYDSTKYDGVTEILFAGTAKVTGGTGTLRLQGTGGSPTFDISVTSTTYGYVTSGDIKASLTNGTYEVLLVDPVGQTITLQNAKVIIRQSAFTKLTTYQDQVNRKMEGLDIVAPTASGAVLDNESAHTHSADHDHASVTSGAPQGSTGGSVLLVAGTQIELHTHSFNLPSLSVTSGPGQAHNHTWNNIYEHQHLFTNTETDLVLAEVANGTDLSSVRFNYLAVK